MTKRSAIRVVASIAGAVVLLLGAILASFVLPPMKPWSLQAGAWNGGTILKPTRWFVCESVEPESLDCRMYDVSGSKLVLQGIYVPVSPKQMSDRSAAHDANLRELTRYIEWYKGNYLVRVLEIRPPLATGDTTEIEYRDSDCVRNILAGADVRYSALAPTQALESALAEIYAHFPAALENVGPAGDKRTSSGAFIRWYAPLFPAVFKTICGYAFTRQ